VNTMKTIHKNGADDQAIALELDRTVTAVRYQCRRHGKNSQELNRVPFPESIGYILTGLIFYILSFYLARMDTRSEAGLGRKEKEKDFRNESDISAAKPF
jgi:hypothetical protein